VPVCFLAVAKSEEMFRGTADTAIACAANDVIMLRLRYHISGGHNFEPTGGVMLGDWIFKIISISLAHDAQF
jgi:hypothetical protein